MPIFIIDYPNKGDWTTLAEPYADLQNEPFFDTANERNVRFDDALEAAAWAIDAGIDGFSYIVSYVDGTYGIYVDYENV